VGNGADGSVANFGGVSGIFGDGNADGMVVRTLSLNSGFYSLFIGGAQYYDLLNTGGDATGSYGFSVTLTTIPEPSSFGLLVAGAALVVMFRRRSSSGRNSTP
jgi:PEP-CTERM motif